MTNNAVIKNWKENNEKDHNVLATQVQNLAKKNVQLAQDNVIVLSQVKELEEKLLDKKR